MFQNQSVVNTYFSHLGWGLHRGKVADDLSSAFKTKQVRSVVWLVHRCRRILLAVTRAIHGQKSSSSAQISQLLVMYSVSVSFIRYAKDIKCSSYLNRRKCECRIKRCRTILLFRFLIRRPPLVNLLRRLEGLCEQIATNRSVTECNMITI